jgi:hypothetical protein
MEVKAPTWDAEIAPFLLLRLGFDLVVRRRHGGRRPSLRPLFTAHGLALRGRRTLVALPGPLLLAPLLVPFVVVHRDDLHRDVDGARLPVDGGGLRLRGNRFESGRRRGVGADLRGASSNSEKKPPPASCDGHETPRARDHVYFKMLVLRLEELLLVGVAP